MDDETCRAVHNLQYVDPTLVYNSVSQIFDSFIILNSVAKAAKIKSKYKVSIDFHRSLSFQIIGRHLGRLHILTPTYGVIVWC